MNKVIVIDDEPLVLKVAQKLLTKLNFDVIAVDSEQKVTEELRKTQNPRQPITFALIDLNIPGTDIAKMIKKIRESEPNAKIIITTGSVADDISSSLGQTKYDAVLNKPYSIEDLKFTLSNLGF